MVSLDPELSKLFILLMSTSGSFGSQNGPTLANFLKRKLETSFLQHESKIEESLRFFPDYLSHKKGITCFHTSKQIELDFKIYSIAKTKFYQNMMIKKNWSVGLVATARPSGQRCVLLNCGVYPISEYGNSRLWW